MLPKALSRKNRGTKIEETPPPGPKRPIAVSPKPLRPEDPKPRAREHGVRDRRLGLATFGFLSRFISVQGLGALGVWGFRF